MHLDFSKAFDMVSPDILKKHSLEEFPQRQM